MSAAELIVSLVIAAGRVYCCNRPRAWLPEFEQTHDLWDAAFKHYGWRYGE
jgi:hypothetical protein